MHLKFYAGLYIDSRKQPASYMRCACALSIACIISTNCLRSKVRSPFRTHNPTLKLISFRERVFRQQDKNMGRGRTMALSSLCGLPNSLQNDWFSVDVRYFQCSNATVTTVNYCWNSTRKLKIEELRFLNYITYHAYSTMAKINITFTMHLYCSTAGVLRFFGGKGIE